MTRSTLPATILLFSASLLMLAGCHTTVVQPVQKDVVVKPVPDHHDDHRQPPPPPPDHHDDHNPNNDRH